MSGSTRTTTRRHGHRRSTGLPAGSRSFVGWIELTKGSGRTAYRSACERDALIRLELDPGVASIERNDLSDLERIDFRAGSLAPNRLFTLPDGATYTPDLRVRMRDGRLVFIEVGPQSAKLAPLTAQRLEAARVEVTSMGAELVVLTERATRGRGMENARRLIGHLRPISQAPLLVKDAAALLCSAAEPLSVAEAVARLAQAHAQTAEVGLEEAVWCAIARAAQRGDLLFDLDESEINASSRFAIAPSLATLRSWFERVIAAQHEGPVDYNSVRSSLAASMVRTVELEMSEKDRREYQLRLAIVRDRQANPQLTWAQLAERHGVTPRRARYFWNESEQYGEAELRPHQRKCTGARAPDELLQLVDKLWRGSRKLGLTAILQHPELRARMKELDARISYHQLWRYTRQLDRDPVARAQREGKRIPPPQASGPVDPFKKIEVPLQAIQVDAARADIIVLSRDGRSVLERPWILWAIDVATRCVWSWSVCEDTPSEIDYLRLMRKGFLPKDELVREHGAQNAYPVLGIPQLILADRGWQFAAMRSRERLAEIGVIVEHAAAYRPDMKGTVERLIRTINERWIHRLPGTTLSSIKQRGGHDSVAEARRYGLTLDRFDRLLALAVVDGYAHEFHSSLRSTPLERWAKLCDRYGPPRRWPQDPASRLQLALFALKDGGTRTRDQRGYFFQNLLYRPAAQDAPALGRVLYDPDDMRSIAILDAESGAYSCEATARDLDLAVAISERELKCAARSASSSATGTEALADLVERVETKDLSRRQATRLEKAMRAARERRQGAAETASAVASAHVEAQELVAVPDLELAASPDFEEHVA